MGPIVYVIAVVGILLILVCVRYFGNTEKVTLGSEDEVRKRITERNPDFVVTELLLSEDGQTGLAWDDEQKQLMAMFVHGLFILHRVIPGVSVRSFQKMQGNEYILNVQDFDRSQYDFVLANQSTETLDSWTERLQSTGKAA